MIKNTLLISLMAISISSAFAEQDYDLADEIEFDTSETFEAASVTGLSALDPAHRFSLSYQLGSSGIKDPELGINQFHARYRWDKLINNLRIIF